MKFFWALHFTGNKDDINVTLCENLIKDLLIYFKKIFFVCYTKFFSGFKYFYKFIKSSWKLTLVTSV